MTAVELAAEAHAERCQDGWVREVTVFGAVKVKCVLCKFHGTSDGKKEEGAAT